MTINKEIKDSMKDRKLVIGTRAVFKEAKRGHLIKAIHSSNIPDKLIGELEHYSKLSKMETVPFKDNSTILGQTCGKPFRILTVGIKK